VLEHESDPTGKHRVTAALLGRTIDLSQGRQRLTG
jgi:hypothetical protein